MISKIIFIRHGLTEGNRKHWFYGGVDIPLLDEGIRELERNKARRIYPEIPEDADCYTTGLIRTEQTLKTIYGNRDFTEIPALQEMKFGDYECRTFEELSKDDRFMKWASEPDGEEALPGGGDSMKGFERRIREGLHELVNHHWMKQWSHRHSGKDAVSVMVCHGGSISHIMEELFPGRAKTFWDWLPNPGLGYEVEFAGNTPVMYRRLQDMRRLGFRVGPLAVSDQPIEAKREIIDYVMMTGHRLLDVSPELADAEGVPVLQGETEDFSAREITAKYDRDTYYLLSGLPASAADSVEKADEQLNASMNRLETDHFDYYVLRDLDEENFRSCEEHGIWDWLSDKKKQKQLEKIGIRFCGRPEILEKILEEHGNVLDFVEMPLNYAEWYAEGEERDCYQITIDHYLSVILTNALDGGMLADLPEGAKKILQEEASGQCSIEDRSEDMWKVGEISEEAQNFLRRDAAWAFRFALDVPRVEAVLFNTSQINHAEEDIMAEWTYRPISREERTKLHRLSAILKHREP